MGLNFNSELSLGKKKTQYPSKTTLNLVMRDGRPRSLAKLLPMLAVIFAAAVVFSKFAVIDRIQMVRAAEAEAGNSRARLEALLASNSDYDDVYEEYLRYSKLDDLTGEALVNRITVLKLIEDELLGSARVESFTVSLNTLSVNLADINLTQTSVILKSLYKSPIVADVKVSTAGSLSAQSGAQPDAQTPSAEAARVSMTITLAVPSAQGETGGDAQ